jgi:hypothetical protein
LFLPPKLAYKYCYYTVEGIPIGWIIVIISLIIKYI